jgi:membrane-associated phospholipid phosphatase
MRKNIRVTIFFIITSCISIFNTTLLYPSYYKHLNRPTKFHYSLPSHAQARSFLHNNFNNLYDIGEELFSLESMKIITHIAPFYLIARGIDKPLHKKFYDYINHTNLKQPPRWVKIMLFDLIPIIPPLIYGLTGWTHDDEEARQIAQVFGVGFIWVWCSKMLLKEFKVSSCLRPLNGKYETKRVHGGNPSGHTSIATFAATYLGLARGPRWGIPLGLGAAVVGTLGFISNTHYISQIVAGAGLGILIGSAAYRVTEKRMPSSSFSIDIETETNGKIGVSLAYNF